MGQVTERTFYPVLMDIIRALGGSAVSEIEYPTSEPDIIFELLGRRWILSVKIGESLAIYKSAFIQYQRHKEDSRLESGLILFLPDTVRKTKVNQQAMTEAVNVTQVACIIDAPGLKEEYRGLPFPEVMDRLISEVGPKLAQQVQQAYPLKLVISLLQQHVSELMETVSLSDPEMMRVITDRKLLSGLSHLNAKETEEVARFLAAYIVLSQILFLRLYGTAQPDKLTPDLRPVSHHSLRRAFDRILEIDYRPIYEINVLDSVSENYLRDTFDLIWGLEVEKVRYELPGRIFHELMPSGIRKMLAAFYTRPQAADILAHLVIQHSDDTSLDLASGSGTILVSAYRRKLELFHEERRTGNPHKRFCEDEIFGADIMPFAVHLTGANLASMDPSTTIERAQIIQGDSLKLSLGRAYTHGIQVDMFPTAREAQNTSGERYKVNLRKVTTILMNPPFTKVERGISAYVDMKRFGGICGGEVGLWGHFIALADEFLDDDGIYGAVIPINFLRGRESLKIREFAFERWTPLYVLKPTFNYGFSEWSEYRDILFIARKGTPPSGHQVKFCLVKQDLTKITRDDSYHIGQRVNAMAHLRSDDLDIQTFPMTHLKERFTNLMWFCGVSDLNHRDILVSFIGKFSGSVGTFPAHYFREGYRPVPKGVSSFLFLTRNSEPCRIEEAFLHFDNESLTEISSRTQMGAEYDIEKSALIPTLRTGVGLKTMNIQGKWDYLTKQPYKAIKQVIAASGFKRPDDFDWEIFWNNIDRQTKEVSTNIVVVHRINPYSPNTYLTSFVSTDPISPSNMLNVVQEKDLSRAKAICALFNSSLFLSQFFILKEESTGRNINVRFYDLEEMQLYPDITKVGKLAAIYDKFGDSEFPSLREQFDMDFDQRYEEFWEFRRSGQTSLFNVMKRPVRPTKVRLDFDLAVCRALGVEMSVEDLVTVYGTIVKEMIVTRGLQRD